ncbi:SH3 domain-containing protein [Ancylobacter pratisalsi]|uniref:SH3 domain-containing protein n=1 Tax=Ancylobacter pratisalsi TaxID=1745854 RepID=A0A6P1YPT6_9HYPH|nr:SH3 domain-containing protein [Ancylobacter pratisalsi]
MKRFLASAALLLALGGAALAQQPGFVTTTVNLRAGPSTTYPVVVVLQEGMGLGIYGCLDDYSWCDVDWRGNRGWIAARYLESDYRGRRVDLDEYAPTIGVPVVGFNFGNYWGRYYRGRSWYADYDRWGGPPPAQHRPPPGPGWGPPPPGAGPGWGGPPPGARPGWGAPPPGSGPGWGGPPPGGQWQGGRHPQNGGPPPQGNQPQQGRPPREGRPNTGRPPQAGPPQGGPPPQPAGPPQAAPPQGGPPPQTNARPPAGRQRPPENNAACGTGANLPWCKND